MDPVIASPETLEHIREILVQSTIAGREASGSCAARRATPRECYAAGLDSERAWVIEDFRVDLTGDAWSVPLPPNHAGRWHFHTHPGLHLAIGYFSETDERAADSRDTPLLVLGYTTLGPEFLSLAALTMGWPGLATGAAVQAALRMEASGRLPLRLLPRAVVARVYFPGGGSVPVQDAVFRPHRRALEQLTFQVDRSSALLERRLRSAFGKVWGRKS